MKTILYTAILCATVVSPAAYAIDQWPGQSDFGSPNGAATDNNDPYRPIIDFRFGRPAPQAQRQPAPQPRSSLTPAEYNYCRHVQYEAPALDISCEGPNLP